MNQIDSRNWLLRTKIALSAVAVATIIALPVFEPAYAEIIVFRDRVAFNAALDSNPLLIKKVEGWDTMNPANCPSEKPAKRGSKKLAITSPRSVVSK